MDYQKLFLRVYSRKKGKMQQDQKNQEKMRDYSDLPRDILQSIAEGLEFMELLAFRKTCKVWRSASSTSTAKIESNPGREPWFLLYRSGSQDCKLVPESRSKHYTLSIAELSGAKCVSSKQGWLLCLRENSMFFFSPFSGAKLNLPDPEFTENFLAASFSSDPISPNCIVCALSSALIEGIRKVQCWELRRNSTEWNLIDVQDNNYKFESSEGTVYYNGRFYFCSEDSKVFTCDLEERSLSRCSTINYVTESKPGVNYLPWKRMCFSRTLDEVKEVIGISQDVNVSTCGTVVAARYGKAGTMIPGENDKENGEDCLRGVWIQPRLHWIDAEQKW